MADPITLPPELPTRKQAGFSDKFSAWLIWFNGTFITQLINAIKALNFNSTSSVSTTSLAIGTGAKSLAVDASKSYLPGHTVKIARTSDGTKWMVGDVTAYNSTTGALEITITKVQGSGTFTDWTITLAATEQIDEQFVDSQTEVTAATGDSVLIADVSDSGKKKKTLISSILALVADASTTQKGISELATSAEMITGTDPARVPSVDAIRQGLLVPGSVVTTTSGTAHQLLSNVPSWVKRITISYSSLSLSGTSSAIIQIGDSGGLEAAGYAGASAVAVSGAGTTGAVYTTGFGITLGAAANVAHGSMILTLIDPANNTWSASGTHGLSNANASGSTGGSKSLSGPLTSVSVLSLNGSDTFDSGTFRAIFE